jgi:hypothetical protein
MLVLITLLALYILQDLYVFDLVNLFGILYTENHPCTRICQIICVKINLNSYLLNAENLTTCGVLNRLW